MREKLIELFIQEHERCQNTLCSECKYDHDEECGVNALVDHLIANGVILKDDTSCMQRFIATESSLDIKRMISEWENKPAVFYADHGESIIPIPQWEWIPVTERLPEVGQRILVYCESKTTEKHVTACTYMGGLYGHKQFSRHVRKVTHWMPLPEPPKEV